MENIVSESPESFSTQVTPHDIEPHDQSFKLKAAITCVIGILLFTTGFIGYYLGKNADSTQAPQAEVVTPTFEPEGVACTLDAMICPDGSAVGRTGPNCEFAPCPGEAGTSETITQGWRTYSNTIIGYDIKYPVDWQAVNLAAGGGESTARSDSQLVDIQSPDLLLGNATLQLVQLLPQPGPNQSVSEETIRGKSLTVYTSNVHNMLSKTYYAPVTNNSYLEILMRPVSDENKIIFQSMIESLEISKL